MSDEDADRPCREPVQIMRLDDVTGSDYFRSGEGVPAAGTRVRLGQLPRQRRLQVLTEDGRTLGLVPPPAEHLLDCRGQGYEYRGTVQRSALRPVPLIQVELVPDRSRQSPVEEV